VVYHAPGTPAAFANSTAAVDALRACGEARVGDVEHLAAVAARHQQRPPARALGEFEALERVPGMNVEGRNACGAAA